MNARVEAGPMVVNVSMTTETKVVSTVTVELNVSETTWTCFSLSKISINGHSLNAINPDFEVGELATSIAA